MNVDKKWLQAIIDEYGEPQLSGATQLPHNRIQHGWVFGDHFIDIELDVRRGEIKNADNGRTNNVWQIIDKELMDDGHGYQYYRVEIDHSNPVTTIDKLEEDLLW